MPVKWMFYEIDDDLWKILVVRHMSKYVRDSLIREFLLRYANSSQS